MWDSNYKVKHYRYGTEPNDFLKESFAIIPKGEVLCLAEGEGRNAVFLAKQGYRVTAVDSSIVGLQKAQDLSIKNQVSIECIHADLDGYDIGENKWDGIVSIFCHIPPQIRTKVHKKIATGLKTKGVFLLEAYEHKQIKYGTGGPTSTEYTMSEQLLQRELIGMRFNLLQEIEREVFEGTHHIGLGAVVQAIAAKVSVDA